MVENLSVLMIDGASHNGIPLNVARCLTQVPGLQLHILSENQWAPLRFSRRRHTYRVHSAPTNNEECIEIIKKAVKYSGAEIIFPVMEPAIRFVSAYKELLNEFATVTPASPPNILDQVWDKWALAQLLAKFNIPAPSTILYTADEDFECKVDELTFPVLIKPTFSSSGIGIRYFETRNVLRKFLKEINSQKFAHHYIVQSFIHGDELSCNILCQNGKILAYTIQKGYIPRSSSFSPPAGIEYIKNDQVLDVVEKLVSVVQWNGVANIDLRYDYENKLPKVIEVNPRFWGSVLGTTVVAGINFPYLLCLTALNTSFAMPDYRLERYVDFTGVAEQIIRRVLGKNNRDGIPIL